DFLLHEMAIVIDIFSQLDSKIDETEALIRECVLEINPPMLTIPGIGIESAAVILAEFGDFSKFENPAQLLSFAGMEPGYFQSGTSETKGKMVKHGSSYLRYTLMNCARSVANYEPTFAEYYAKKRAQGKTFRVALSHTAKKLLRVLFTIQTKNLVYDPDAMR
ncbi:MAG: IS110 family transposase, partial [Clostridia bacterium]|nr:IS110 family transposase [Clostridia bacterium]